MAWKDGGQTILVRVSPYPSSLILYQMRKLETITFLLTIGNL